MQFRPYHAALLSGLGVWSLRISAKGGPFLLIVCIVERLLPFGTLAFAEFPAYSQVFHEDFAPWSLSLRNCATLGRFTSVILCSMLVASAQFSVSPQRSDYIISLFSIKRVEFGV